MFGYTIQRKGVPNPIRNLKAAWRWHFIQRSPHSALSAGGSPLERVWYSSVLFHLGWARLSTLCQLTVSCQLRRGMRCNSNKTIQRFKIDFCGRNPHPRDSHPGDVWGHPLGTACTSRHKYFIQAPEATVDLTTPRGTTVLQHGFAT